MSRDDGFAIADVATGHFDDPKVRKLWRLLGDPDAMTRALVVHFAVLLGSWGEGRRVTVDEAVPVWLTVSDETLAALRSAGLIDRQGRLPRRSWDSWYGPAARRREAARAAGAEGNRIRWGARDKEATGSRSGGDPRPYRTVPTDPSIARAPARRRGGAARIDQGPTSLGEALKGTPLGEAFAAKERG